MSVLATANRDIRWLDQVARLSNRDASDEGLLETVERLASMPGGPQVLIDRYAASPNPVIVRALSFAIAQQANTPSFETWDATLRLAARLSQGDDVSSLINGLTAIQRHLILAPFLVRILKSPLLLSEFLLHCLDGPLLVQETAIWVLTHLADDGLLVRAFPPARASVLRRKLAEIHREGDDDLARDVGDLLAAMDGR